MSFSFYLPLFNCQNAVLCNAGKFGDGSVGKRS